MEEVTRQAKEIITGYRKDVVLATGVDIDQKMKCSEASLLTSETMSEREKDLLGSWGGEVFKIETKDRPDRFYLRRAVEGERQVVMVVELNREVTTKEEEKRTFFIKKRKNRDAKIYY